MPLRLIVGTSVLAFALVLVMWWAYSPSFDTKTQTSPLGSTRQALEASSARTEHNEERIDQEGVQRSKVSITRRGSRAIETTTGSRSSEICYRRCGTACAPDGHCPPECMTEENCAKDEVCIYTGTEAGMLTGARDSLIRRCIGSTCETPMDCSPGEQCLRVTRGFRTVRVCSRTGVRKLGEPCMGGLSASRTPRERTCGEGLKCKGVVCMPVATCETDEDCVFGKCRSFAPNPGEKSCFPICDNDSECFDGQRCSIRPTTGMCVPSTTPVTCLETGCPQGKVCVTHIGDWLAPIAECVPPCERQIDCPNGAFCQGFPAPPGSGLGLVYGCLDICRSNGDCQKGLVCETIPQLGVAGCLPHPESLLQSVYDRYR